jgi:hypothetical protein
MDGIRDRISRSARAAAPVLLALDGLLVVGAGVLAVSGSLAAVQGEGPLLFVAGVALIGFGLMIAIRWQLAAAKAGLIAMAAGYFAAALSEFEVATDPCDIGAALAACATDLVKGEPYGVYQGPLILAVLAFVVIALEPFVAREAGGRT